MAFVKGLFGGKGKDGKPDERTDAQKQADLDKGVSEGDALLANEKLSFPKKLRRSCRQFRPNTR